MCVGQDAADLHVPADDTHWDETHTYVEDFSEQSIQLGTVLRKTADVRRSPVLGQALQDVAVDPSRAAGFAYVYGSRYCQRDVWFLSAGQSGLRAGAPAICDCAETERGAAVTA